MFELIISISLRKTSNTRIKLKITLEKTVHVIGKDFSNVSETLSKFINWLILLKLICHNSYVQLALSSSVMYEHQLSS